MHAAPGITFVTTLAAAQRYYMTLFFSFRGGPDELLRQMNLLMVYELTSRPPGCPMRSVWHGEQLLAEYLHAQCLKACASFC